MTVHWYVPASPVSQREIWRVTVSFSTLIWCLLSFLISFSLRKQLISNGEEPETVPSKIMSDPFTSSADWKDLTNAGGSIKTKIIDMLYLKFWPCEVSLVHRVLLAVQSLKHTRWSGWEANCRDTETQLGSWRIYWIVNLWYWEQVRC